MKYLLTHSNKRSISLRIIDENTVKICAPYNTDREVIEKFVLSKKSWIERKVNLLKTLSNKFSEVINGNKTARINSAHH